MMRLRKGPPDLVIFLVVILLLSIGLVMVFSASSVTSYVRYNDSFYYLKKQLLWAVIGVMAMIAAMNIDYFRTKRYVGPALIVVIFLLVAVLIPGIGKEIKGSSRWIGIGSLSLQPSELAKLAMVFFMARSLSINQDKIKSFLKGLSPHLVLLGVVSLLIMAQPDLGTTVVLAGTTYIMLLAAGADWKQMSYLALAGVVLVAVAIYFEPYRMRRFTAFLDPWQDPRDSGFQTVQSLLALGSGGLIGMGLGRSRQKFFYLPEQHTDFIYAILGEELGFLGAVLVLILFFLLAWRGFRTAISSQDSYGSLLAVGLTSMVILQAVVNIGVVTGSLPVTGITLPLISYGGSSLTFILIGIGILLNISRYATPNK